MKNIWIVKNVIGYFFSPATYLVYNMRQRKVDKRWDGLLISTYFAMLGFFFIPNSTSDLNRYFVILDGIRSQPILKYFSGWSMYDVVLSLQKIYFFLIASLGNNHFLPAITMFIVYFIGLWMIYDQGKNGSVTFMEYRVAQITFLLLVPFAMIVNNTRNILAVAVFILALYVESFHQDKLRIWLVLYIASMSIHSGVWPFIVIRLLLEMVNLWRKRKFEMFWATSLFFSMALTFLSFLPMGRMYIDKAISYISGGQTDSKLQKWFAQVDSSFFAVSIKRSFLLLGAAAIIFLWLNRKVLLKKTPFNLYVFSIISAVLLIFFALRPGTTWYRFVFPIYFLIPLFIPVSIKLFQNVRKTKTKIYIVFAVMFFLMLLVAQQLYQIKNQTGFSILQLLGFIFPWIWIFI